MASLASTVIPAVAGMNPLKSMLDGVELESKIEEKIRSLDGARELKDRHRSLKLVIANHYNRNLLFRKEYFDSGTMFSDPDVKVAPGQVTVATVANKQGGFLTGVTGGMAFEIEGTGKYLIIGFCNPHSGSYKFSIGIANEPNAELGYNNSWDSSLKQATTDGFALVAKMADSKIAMRRFVYGISSAWVAELEPIHIFFQMLDSLRRRQDFFYILVTFLKI